MSKIMEQYDYALQEIITENWHGLFFIMIRTDDDILRKKIEQLLQSFETAPSQNEIILYHEALLTYIHHAQRAVILS